MLINHGFGLQLQLHPNYVSRLSKNQSLAGRTGQPSRKWRSTPPNRSHRPSLGPRVELAQQTGAAGRVTRLMISINRSDHLLMECISLSAVRRCLDGVRGTAAAAGHSFACCGVGACGMGFGCHADGGIWPALGSIPSQTN